MTGTNLLAGVNNFNIFKSVFLVTWPLWLLIAVVALGKLAYQLWEKQRLAKSGIADIDQMSGTERVKRFETPFS